MPPSVSATVRPAGHFAGRLRVPGDKSISHRYALLAALASGPSTIHDYSPGADCQATLACLESLGVSIHRDVSGLSVTVIGRGPGSLSSPSSVLNAQNSGTTTRLLAGTLAGQPLEATITGDGSLLRRPMRRVIVPLERMGAVITSDAGRLPMTIRGGSLSGLDHTTETPSAQVKSAVLLAGLQARGRTRVSEAHATRNHTELALQFFGATVETGNRWAAVDGGQRLEPVEARVPGDLSSAAFWLVAAAAVPGGDVTIEGVGLNPTRTGLLRVLDRAGARVESVVERIAGGEPVGRIRVRHRDRIPLVVGPDEVPDLIDELPALAALATHGGSICVSGAGELRVKESDRITALVAGLRALGADAEESSDGFQVTGGPPITGGTADSAGDHRLAMAFALAALGARDPSTIEGAGAVDVSYPGFFDRLAELTA